MVLLKFYIAKEVTGQMNGKISRTISHAKCVKNMFGNVNCGMAAGGWEHHDVPSRVYSALVAGSSWEQCIHT